jgi:enoyl-CoA hydratase/carnithine racemase
MAWEIQETKGVAIVHMNSNSVNRRNPAFFADLANALDRLEAGFGDLPVILTSKERIFSAGFDFDYWFPLIARGDVDTVQRSYTEFKKINLRHRPNNMFDPVSASRQICLQWRLKRR